GPCSAEPSFAQAPSGVGEEAIFKGGAGRAQVVQAQAVFPRDGEQGAHRRLHVVTVQFEVPVLDRTAGDVWQVSERLALQRAVVDPRADRRGLVELVDHIPGRVAGDNTTLIHDRD